MQMKPSPSWEGEGRVRVGPPFEPRRCRRAAGEESGEVSAETVRAETLPAVRVEGRSPETRAELIPQAWPFELKGEALRRELSGSAAWLFELKSEALRRELS